MPEMLAESTENTSTGKSGGDLLLTTNMPLSSPSSGLSPAGIWPLIRYLLLVRKRQSLQTPEAYVKLLTSLDGRDKFTKLLQYWSRLLAHWLYAWSRASTSAQRQYLVSMAERCQALRTSLTNSRKAFRFGRTFLEFYNVSQSPLCKTLRQSLFLNDLTHSANKQLPAAVSWKMVASVVKMLGLAGFWFGDNVAYLAQVGVLKDTDFGCKIAHQCMPTDPIFLGLLLDCMSAFDLIWT
jgi:Peroxisomal biogenesis factor 11 (PEX11)